MEYIVHQLGQQKITLEIDLMTNRFLIVRVNFGSNGL